jgi:hypothetical protein
MPFIARRKVTVQIATLVIAEERSTTALLGAKQMRNEFGGNKEAVATTFGDLKIVSIDTLEGTTSIPVIGGRIVLIVE